MRVSIILARSSNGVIGKNGQLPWHLPADLKYFKQTTRGNAVLMGRKTFEALGKPLPNRRNVVLSATANFNIPDLEIFPTLSQALDALNNEPEVYLIGGGKLCEQAIELGVVDRILLTEIEGNFEGDTFFTWKPDRSWIKLKEESFLSDERNLYNYCFVEYVRNQDE
jgi:dihydrofolate reductase